MDSLYDYQDSLSEDDSLDWDYVDRKTTSTRKTRSTNTKTKTSTKPCMLNELLFVATRLLIVFTSCLLLFCLATAPAKRRSAKPEGDAPVKRPGRRPMEKSPVEDLPKDPKLKRKAQNRAAQRAFRERKERYVAELQERIRQLEEEKTQKDSELVQENERLKQQLKTLQEENYALKGTPFTFSFATPDITPSIPKQLPIGLPSPDTHATEDLTGSSSSSTSGSGSEHSPETYSRDDESLTKLGTPDALATFGAIPSTNEYTDNDSGLDTIPSYSSNDLFFGKDSLFADYRAPADDLLMYGDSLPPLFGEDLFGLSGSAPFHVDVDPVLDELISKENDVVSCEKSAPCKDMLLKTLRDAKGRGRRAYDVKQEVKHICPSFNLDDLCDELRNKASCKDSNYILTDKDVDCFIKCVERA
ncbi:hypothetical protein EC973_001735 [Apophysomyces ossiformis]|uniref:BZIP domain-containing protein n=1 Tax=Apophysomyces ossiformis TaxID=679940 RepID=A0A8H7BPR2_9FUNG|nr:hypothetical protein EC973_001735 [Apophysomyces ossiformis]